MSQQLEDFRQKCAGFDWHYEWSDDQDVWRAGRIAQQCLFSEATQLGPDALDIYFEHIPGRSVG